MEIPVTDTTTRAAGTEWVPVDACTLPSADQPLRLAEFDELFATSLRDIPVRPPGTEGARLLLAGDASLHARVQQLADAESSCCSFFTFTVTTLEAASSQEDTETVVALDVEVPAARTDVLDALVRRAAAARTAA
jgi:hypothetical protein